MLSGTGAIQAVGGPGSTWNGSTYDSVRWSGGGGGGSIAVVFGGTAVERDNILDGDLGSAMPGITCSDLSGTLSVTNGVGYEIVDPDDDAKPGTLVFLTVKPPSGTVIVVR